MIHTSNHFIWIWIIGQEYIYKWFLNYSKWQLPLQTSPCCKKDIKYSKWHRPYSALQDCCPKSIQHLCLCYSLFRILFSFCAGWNKWAGSKASHRDTCQSVTLYRGECRSEIVTLKKITRKICEAKQSELLPLTARCEAPWSSWPSSH